MQPQQSNQTENFPLNLCGKKIYYARRFLLVFAIINVTALLISLYAFWYTKTGLLNVVAMLILSVILFMRWTRKYVVITNDTITIHNGIKEKSILFKNLLDVTVKNNLLILHSKLPGMQSDFSDHDNIYFNTMLAKDRQDLINQLQIIVEDYRQNQH